MRRSATTRAVAVGVVVVAGVALACAHFVDPREAANTDVGLQVWASVAPTTLSIRDTVSRLRVRISAKNPGLDTVRVENGGLPCSTPLDPASSRGTQHSMRIADDASDLDAGPRADLCGTTLLIYPPKRTRAVDFYVTIKQWRAGGWPLVANQYRVRSYFAGYEGYSALFTLVP